MLRDPAASSRSCRRPPWRYAWVLATACWIPLAHAGALWFADSQGMHRVETDTNVVTLNVAQRSVLDVVLDPQDGSVWALTDDHLFKYDANGVKLAAIDLGRLSRHFNDARRLALDPADHSVWVAGGQSAYHLDAGGSVLASVDVNDDVQDIALAQDESLWVLGQHKLARYAPRGSRLGWDELDDGLRQAQFMAVDDGNAALWLGGSKKVYRVALALPVRVKLSLNTKDAVSALALDAGTGNLWVAGQTTLFGYGKEGAALATTKLSARGIYNPQALAFDAGSQGLWLGHTKGISRFDAAGRWVATLAAFKVNAIGAGFTSSGVVPIVTLVSPPAGALGRDAFIPIRVHYDASCSGQPCNFPPGTFAAYTLSATLNGQGIGNAFLFDPATNDAVYTPGTRYPEGANTFSAFVTDDAGRRSQSIASTFTIDTVAPHFVNVTPADGTMFSSPAISLQGSLDDILGQVLLENFSGAVVTGANPQGQSFSYAITLQPGTNSFRLTARDPAGNASQLSLAYVYSAATLTLMVTSPADGAIIDADTVTVTGTFSGSSTASVTVNGVAALVTGNAFTASAIPLHFGANTLTVAGTTPQGASDTRTLTVTSTFPSIAIATPSAGAAVAGDSVLVQGTIQAPANSGVTVNGIVAPVDAASAFSAVVPVVPGVNTLTATVTNPTRSSSSAAVSVNATGVAPAILASASPASGLAPLAVTFTLTNPTDNDASFTFDGFGPFSLPAQAASQISLTYPAGVYTPTIVATDTLGNTTTQTLVVESQDGAQLDALLRSMWSGMNSALIAGDRVRALGYLNDAGQVRYGPVFDALMPDFPSIIATYSAPQLGSIAQGIGEYAVGRTVHGARQIFFVYFLRDVDGVWRINSM